jgi:hypothetical protein
MELRIQLQDGREAPLTGATVRVSVIHGNGKIREPKAVTQGEAIFQIEDDLSESAKFLTVSAESKGYLRSGIMGKRIESRSETIQILLPSREAKLIPGAQLPWHDAASWPKHLEVSDEQFLDAVENSTLCAAFALNLAGALQSIPGGEHLLGAFELFPLNPVRCEDRRTGFPGICRDRMLTRVKRDFVELMGEHVKTGAFKTDSGSGHEGPKPGLVRRSWRELRYDEANLQFTTFSDPQSGETFLDVDFDYFKDKFSHIFMEYLPNTVFKSKTNPMQIYVRRWMQSRNFPHAGVAEFSPAYQWRRPV